MLNEVTADATRHGSCVQFSPRRAQGNELRAKEHDYRDKEPRPGTFGYAERTCQAGWFLVRILVARFGPCARLPPSSIALHVHPCCPTTKSAFRCWLRAIA